MIDDIENNWIEKYFSGELSEKEKIEIEDKLENDTDFKSKFEEYELLFQTVVFSELFELEKEIKSFNPNENSGSSSWKSFSIIAFIGVLLFSSSFFNNKLKQEELPETNAIAIVEKKIEHKIENQIEKDKSTETVPSKRKEKLKPKKTENLPESEKEPDLKINSETEIIPEKSKEEEVLVKEEETIEIGITEAVEANVKIESPCVTKEISFDYKISKACENQDNGSMIIHGIKGGKEPYTILLDNESDSDLQHLFPGDYEVLIQDADNCFSERKLIEVQSINCTQENDLAISVLNDDFYLVKEDCHLMIFSESGEIVLNEFVYAPYKWFGRDKQGNPLSLGTYNVIIKQLGKKDSIKNISIIY